MQQEINLLLQVASSQLYSKNKPEVQDTLINWDKLILIAHKHSVLSLLYIQISKAKLNSDVEFAKALTLGFQTNLMQTVRLASELFRITIELNEVPCKAIPFKGPILSFMAYGDTTLRQAGDIDLLIKRENLKAVEGALIQSGYTRITLDTVAQTRRFLQVDCQHIYVNSAKDITLDLHWEFAPSYWGIKLNSEGLWQRAQPLWVENNRVEVFAPEDTMLVLSLNAAKDLYSRLIRLYDIAGFIQRHPQLDWPVLMARAEAHGLRRMLRVSLWLVHDLLGTPLPEDVLNQIKADRGSLRAAQTARDWLFAQKPLTGGIREMLRPACLMQSPWARLKFYLRLGLTPTLEDWKMVELPSGLDFAYYLLRPLRLARKYLLGGR